MGWTVPVFGHPLLECNLSKVQTNMIGAENIVNAALAQSVCKVVMLSTAMVFKAYDDVF